MTAVRPVPPRTYLYVPADRADRLERVGRFGADAVIADLEDAVSEGDKDRALDNVDEWLASHREGSAAWVRVNSGERCFDELRRIVRHDALAGVLIPKVDSADEIVSVHAHLGRGVRIAPMIESATGLVNVHAIASAPGVHQLHIGEIDLAADLGVEPTVEGTELAYARSLVVIASRHARLMAPPAPVDAVIDDDDAYRASTRKLSRMGYFGRDCIHPKQVVVASDVFTPSDDEVSWAREVLESSLRSRGAFRDSDGDMIDEAVLRRARVVLSLRAAADSVTHAG